MIILYYLELVGLSLIMGAVVSVFAIIFGAIAVKIASYFQRGD